MDGEISKDFLISVQNKFKMPNHQYEVSCYWRGQPRDDLEWQIMIDQSRQAEIEDAIALNYYQWYKDNLYYLIHLYKYYNVHSSPKSKR